MEMHEFFGQHPKVAIACSGGVDSVLLVYLAHKYAKEVRAYFVKSEFQPQFEEDDARKMCAQIGVEMKVITIDILSYKQVLENEKDRCYYCKQRIVSSIMEEMRKDGFDILLDGTNASDDITDRPGMRALQELNVLSPLRLCGYTKEKIRSLAQSADLPVYNKPSYACLATRIPTGTKIRYEDIKRVNMAEDYLFSLGYSDFRVRLWNGAAKLQISEIQMEKILQDYKKIQQYLLTWFDKVVLDLKVR